MSAHKIIFAGPVGSGKTTAVATMSDVRPVTTEEKATDSTRKTKACTTVAMDYGMMKLAGGQRIHLYGAPGQERFDFMWEALTPGGIGLILLINNDQPDALRRMDYYLNAFQPFIVASGLAVGVTKTDLSPQPGLDAYSHQLALYGLTAPVFQVDARQYHDLMVLLQALLYSIDPGLSPQRT